MADIIFLVIVVAFILTRLYNVFGSHAEEKKVRVVVKSVNKETEEQIMREISEALNEKQDATPKTVSPADLANMSEQDKLLARIPAFDKQGFINGANKVFELVLTAFNSGNMESVKELISKKILTAFNEVIAQRKAQNMTSEVDFICFDKSEIKDVKILKNSAKIAVEFITEQVNLLRNAEGKVIEGDENFIQKITDVWTFERSLNAQSNKWLLVSTKKSA
jgi:predicted lipid-binding transport protein (Tim44 family)